jgi:pyruvate kinase
MKPKIICTLGTTTDYDDVLKQMIEHGMACARINTAYASVSDYKRRIDQLRKAGNIPVMMDIKGPQVRIDTDKQYRIENGDKIYIGFKDEHIHFNKDFYKDVEADDIILFENGTIKTKISSKANNKLTLEVIANGEGFLNTRMGVNVPGKYLNVPRLSEKDLEVVDFSLDYNIESIALSFVRDADDIIYLNDTINKKKEEKKVHNKIGITAKIEDKRGVENIRDIIFSARKNRIDLTVMVARGDMYVEMGYADMMNSQKHIIETCNLYKVPVITATGVLESMQTKDKPTRAEIFDVYNAIRQGTDYLMFSGETSNSHNPVLAVKTLKELIEGYK